MITSAGKKVLHIFIFLGLVAFFVWFIRRQIAPPTDFPVPYQLTIESGQTLFSISHELEWAHVVRSAQLFEMFMVALGSERTVSDGEYYFDHPVSSLEIAFRISGRQFGIDKKRVTFPEGFTTKQMADRLAATFPNFDPTLFMTLAKGSEGYLFPDTYGFFPSATPDFMLAAFKRNFTNHVAPLDKDIASSGRTKADIITMASIIEKEANGPEDRSLISGILWNRIDKGLPLQVDAPFLYILGKESKDLTQKDLATNSPYNTYRNKGLPPGPIDNPGLAAIMSAVYPEQSPYLFYLHDADGVIHYASTYAQHKKNIAQYLK